MSWQAFDFGASGMTLIDGANIFTNSIDAASIKSKSITANQIAAGTIDTSLLSFTPTTGSNVIATINASSEGLKISGSRIQIDGTVTFSSGYSPADIQSVAAADATTKANAVSARVLVLERRGDNLVSNGNAELGSNTNFSTLTYSGTDGYNTPGCFIASGVGIDRKNDDLIAVDPTKTYELSVVVKADPFVAGTHAYLGLAPYDMDGNLINTQNYNCYQDTLTTLAVDLKNGDTTITLTSGANWRATPGTTARKAVIFWDYVSASGYAYPPLTYSRHSSAGDLWADGAIAGNVITLRSAWAGGLVPAGTAVSQLNPGASYLYCAGSNIVIPNTWTQFTGRVGGINTTSTPSVTNMFPPGTAAVRFVGLFNRDTTGNATKLGSVRLSLIEKATLDAASAAAAAQTTADAANAIVSDITNDDKLSPAEKQSLKPMYDSWVSEQAGLDTQATAFGITTEKTNYDAALSTLTTWCNTTKAIWSNITLTSDLGTGGGAALRSYISDMLTKKQVLLNKLSAQAKALAESTASADATSKANNAQTNAVNTIQNNYGWSADKTYIDGGRIWTNTVTANQIAAGAITTDKLTVGTVTRQNLLTNGHFGTYNTYGDNYRGWTLNSGSVTYQAGTYTPGGTTTSLSVPKITATIVTGLQLMSQRVSVIPGRTYTLVGMLFHDTGRAGIRVWAVGGNELSTTWSTGVSAGSIIPLFYQGASMVASGQASSTTINTWNLYAYRVTIPTGITQVDIQICAWLTGTVNVYPGFIQFYDDDINEATASLDMVNQLQNVAHGGDVQGSYSALTVRGLQGRTVASTAPTQGQVLGWHTTNNQWQPLTISSWLGYTPANQAGDTFTGAIAAPTIRANPTGDGNSGGFGFGPSDDSSSPAFGLMGRLTSAFGTHGSVTGDYAIYSRINSGGNTRGWIWRYGTSNIASISGTGAANFSAGVTATQFNGSGAGLTGTAASLTAGSASALGTYTQDLQTLTGAGDYVLVRNQSSTKIQLATYSSLASMVQGAATGTWGISISGTAATASALTGVKVIGTISVQAVVGSGVSCTTAEFLAWYQSTYNFKAYAYTVAKCSWSYAGNNDISDGPNGAFDMSGAVIETYSDGTTYTIRIVRPTTGAGGSEELIYNDQGASYLPGWRRVWNSTTLTNLNQLTNGPGYITAADSCNYATTSGTATNATAVGGLSGFGTSVWAGAAGYPGYQFTGGNTRFGFSSTTGVCDVYVSGYVVPSSGVYLTDSNTKLSKSSNGTLRVTSAYGYVDIGPTNTTYAHILTDRGSFYMGTRLELSGDITRYSTATWKLYDYSTGGGLRLKDKTNGKWYTLYIDGGILKMIET